MLLTIDIGNTNLTIGLYEGENLKSHWRLATDQRRMPDEYGLQLLGLLANCGLGKADVEGICIGSVVPPVSSRIAEACRQYLGKPAFLVENQHCTGINVLYDPPTGVGVDRLINCVAVRQKYSFPACVLDFGTATTFDAIDGQANYLGGAITPGIGISSDALFSRTSKLPKVDLLVPPAVIGKNTVHAIQSGLMYGYLSLVEGMIQRFGVELGDDMIVVATGGLAVIFGEHTNAIDYIDPWLTLDGLRMIWEEQQ